MEEAIPPQISRDTRISVPSVPGGNQILSLTSSRGSRSISAWSEQAPANATSLHPTWLRTNYQN